MGSRRVRRGLAALAVTIFVAVGVGVWMQPERAPAVELLTVTGERIALTDLKGFPVLVNFWASTCRSCIEEMPALAGLHRRFGPEGLKVIGIAMSYDMPSQVKAVVDGLGIPYPVALDLNGEHARALAAADLVPYSVLIGRDGAILWRRLGLLDMRELTVRIQALLTEV